MTDIRFADGRSYSQDWLASHQEESQQILHTHKTTHPLCLCTREGIPLYIREMTATGRCYLARMPGTGPRHSVSCPSYEPIHGKAEQEAIDKGAIVHLANGDIEFHLHVGFDIRENSPAPPDDSRPSPQYPQMVSDPPARLGLLALIQYLWEIAELHHWHPKMNGRRFYKQVYNRLLAASEQILVKGFPLKHRLFIPEPFKMERSQEISVKRLERVSQMARGASGTKRRFLVMGEIRKIQGNEDVTRIHLAQVGNELSLQIRTETLERLCKRWDIQLPQEDVETDLKTWGLFLIDSLQNHVLMTRAAALLQTTQHYIPVFSHADIALAYGLVESGRHFIKMLSMDGRPNNNGAAFQLTDCGNKAIPMYIVPGTKPDQSSIDEWYWHTDVDESWPALPSKKLAATKSLSYGR